MVQTQNKKMTEKYQNKYRIKSARLKGYDYSNAGLYFITICTQNREHYFGEIINNKMQLSEIGVVANILWNEIKNHTTNTKLHEFVVMPNHIHGILEILDNNVETLHATSLQQPSPPPSPSQKNKKMANISPKSGSLGRIIGSYKSAVTKQIRQLGIEFNWQTRFHDHIIRNDKSYNKIQNYIIENPAKWENDKFNK